MNDNGINQCSLDLLKFHLESVEAGGPEMVEDDDYEMVGENDASWQVSLSSLCGTAKSHIEWLEQQLTAERERADVLAAFADDFCSAAAQASDVMDDTNKDQCEARCRLDHFRYNLPQKRAMSLAQRDALVAAEAIDQVAMDIRADYGHCTEYNVSLLAAGVDGYAENSRRKADEIAAGGGE